MRLEERDGSRSACFQTWVCYRRFLHLSPDEALARAKTASPAEKPLLEHLANTGWGPIQIYFRLSNQERAALRAGQTLTFSQTPQPGEKSLAPELVHGVLQSFRDWRLRSVGGIQGFDRVERAGPEVPPLTEVPELSVSVTLTMPLGEIGEFTLDGGSNLFFPKGAGAFTPGKGPYASGRNPAALTPDNRAANLRLAGDPALRRRVTVHPHSSCEPDPTARRGGAGGEGPVEPKVTTADVLEALHQATGLPLLADFYTRLYNASEVTVHERLLFDALNQLADTVRLRWRKEGEWLLFRSVSYVMPNQQSIQFLDHSWRLAAPQRSLREALMRLLVIDRRLDLPALVVGARQRQGGARLGRQQRRDQPVAFTVAWVPGVQQRRAFSDDQVARFTHEVVQGLQGFLQLLEICIKSARLPGHLSQKFPDKLPGLDLRGREKYEGQTIVIVPLPLSLAHELKDTLERAQRIAAAGRAVALRASPASAPEQPEEPKQPEEPPATTQQIGEMSQADRDRGRELQLLVAGRYPSPREAIGAVACLLQHVAFDNALALGDIRANDPTRWAYQIAPHAQQCADILCQKLATDAEQVYALGAILNGIACKIERG